MSGILLPRRRFMGAVAAAAGGLSLCGCDALVLNDSANRLIKGAEGLTMRSQRALLDRSALAQEFRPEQISPHFTANGTINPSNPEYRAQAMRKFVDWRFTLDGLVRQPLSLSLQQLVAMPAREQITRHDCVEGWSAIGKWRGVPLALLLKQAQLLPTARYLVFHCADMLDAIPYYESIDLVDAYHPQTLLAWAMNDAMLPVAHGAPLRLRVERQLGYKHAKYVMRVEAVASLASIGKGKGGYWEDELGYEWYAGM